MGRWRAVVSPALAGRQAAGVGAVAGMDDGDSCLGLAPAASGRAGVDLAVQPEPDAGVVAADQATG